MLLLTAFLMLCSSVSFVRGLSLAVASLNEAGEVVANERSWETLWVWMGVEDASDGRRRRAMVGRKMLKMRVPGCNPVESHAVVVGRS
jgi:hypothetical protein